MLYFSSIVFDSFFVIVLIMNITTFSRPPVTATSPRVNSASPTDWAESPFPCEDLNLAIARIGYSTVI